MYKINKNWINPYALRKAFINGVLIPIGNIKITRYGNLDLSSPSFVVATHRNFLDVIISKWVDAVFVAKEEISKYPFIGVAGDMTGIVWIKRQSMTSRVAAKKALEDIVLGGQHVVIYAEGTTNLGEYVLPLRKGAFTIAAKHNVPIVPIVIDFRDDSDLWHREDSMMMLFLKQFAKWRIDIRISIGDPMRGSETDELTTRCETWMNGQLDVLRKDWSRAF